MNFIRSKKDFLKKNSNLFTKKTLVLWSMYIYVSFTIYFFVCIIETTSHEVFQIFFINKKNEKNSFEIFTDKYVSFVLTELCQKIDYLYMTSLEVFSTVCESLLNYSESRLKLLLKLTTKI